MGEDGDRTHAAPRGRCGVWCAYSCPRRVWTHSPVATSHSRAVLSKDADATWRPSEGRQHTLYTSRVWSRSVCTARGWGGRHSCGDGMALLSRTQITPKLAVMMMALLLLLFQKYHHHHILYYDVR